MEIRSQKFVILVQGNGKRNGELGVLIILKKRVIWNYSEIIVKTAVRKVLKQVEKGEKIHPGKSRD